MDILVRNGAIERHQMQKEVGKPAALGRLRAMVRQEEMKATDKWYRGRIDTAEASKNFKNFKKNLDKVNPETLSSAAKDMMWRRAKQLKDEFVIGMLSKEELHPVKGFQENGKMVWVVDEEKMRALNSVERNSQWNKKNEGKVREFKSLMRHLCPENPNAGDIEKFRPKLRGIR